MKQYVYYKKVFGIWFQIIRFTIIISSVFLLPRPENTTAIAVLVGAFGGGLQAPPEI